MTDYHPTSKLYRSCRQARLRLRLLLSFVLTPPRLPAESTSRRKVAARRR
jgi:hypothetical protein